MRVIVGLGNPGPRYRSTPHNVGYEVVDELAQRGCLSWKQARRTDAQIAKGEIAGVNCLLFKPTTYMNASGEAVASLVRGERLKVETDLLAVLDDAALDLGRMRLRAEGSSGGHRGLDSLIVEMQTQRFARLRCGVAPQGAMFEDLKAYVLAKWPKSLREEVDAMVAEAADAAQAWLTEDIHDVMTRFNRKR